MRERADLFATIGAAVRALRARLDRELQGAGLRVGQYQLLRLLWENDGLTPRELADRLVVEMPTVTRTVQRLVRDGFVRRQAHPADARSVRIYLSDRGVRVRSRVSAICAAETERALRGFTRAQRAELLSFMTRIADNARHEDGSPSAQRGVR